MDYFLFVRNPNLNVQRIANDVWNFWPGFVEFVKYDIDSDTDSAMCSKR